MILALAIATLVPLIILYVIYTLDLYKTGNFKYVLLCVACGIAAYLIAKQVNYQLYIRSILERKEIIRYAAPVIEEILKALILIYIVRRPNFTYFVDGAIYGFAAGIGFAVVENYEYIANLQGAGLGLAISRVLSSNMIHATASATIGIAFGLGRFERPLRRILTMLAGLLAAMLLHSAFNHLVISVEGGMLLIYAAGIGLGGAGMIAFIISRGLAEEKQWIEEKLGDADRVTQKEAAIVQKLSSLQDILAPLAERFGSEKAEQIEKFLVIQARLGILRKTLDKLNDDKMRAAVENQMADLRVQMDEARRSVGSYCMLYLRNIFPEDSSPLWGILEQRIQEKIAARPATGGANLFAKLGERVVKPAEPAKDDSSPPAEP